MKQMSTEEFYSALQSNEYGKQYLELIDKVRSENRIKVKGDGNELHHVHPRALGGNRGEILCLSCYEHCLVHVLLAKAIPCYETLGPISRMNYQQYMKLSDIEKISIDDVERWSTLREKCTCLRSEVRRGKPGHPHTEEEKQKISKALKGKTKSEEHRRKIGESRKHIKCKPHSEETKRKISEAHKRLPKDVRDKITQANVKTRREKYGSCTTALNTEEAKQKSLQSRLDKYGSYTAQCLTPEARQKAVATRIEHYGQTQTPEVREKIKQARIEKYGSEMGCMQTPEVKLKRVIAQRKFAALRRNVMHSSEFLQWFNKDIYHYKQSAIKDFLKFSGKVLEDYQ